MSQSKPILFVLVTAAGMVVGCAHATPSELVAARSAYEQAATGPAQEYTPAELHVARKSLARAEALFEDKGDTSAVRDQAYIALRKAAARRDAGPRRGAQAPGRRGHAAGAGARGAGGGPDRRRAQGDAGRACDPAGGPHRHRGGAGGRAGSAVRRPRRGPRRSPPTSRTSPRSSRTSAAR